MPIGKLPEVKADVEGGSVDLAPVISTLTGMYLLNTSNEQIKNSLYEDVKRFVSSRKYELLMEAKDSGEAMRIYTIGNEKIVNGFVMISKDSEETAFICIEGNMDRSQLEALLSQSMK